MKAYLVGCSFLPITAFALTSHLKGDVDVLGLFLVLTLSVVMLTVAVYPEKIARWWARWFPR